MVRDALADPGVDRLERRRGAQRAAEVEGLAGGEELDGQDARGLATTRAAFQAAVGPIETWSSLPAEVGIESTLAGWARVLLSETSAAAVTCAIMRPEWSPPSRARKAGRPERAGFTSRSVRRSLMAPSSAAAIARRSRGERHRLAVEVAAGEDLAGLREDHRVVGGGVHLDLVRRGAT